MPSDPNRSRPTPIVAEPTRLQPSDEPPVVARMVVEIRSDGTRTIARGAMEDRLAGVSVGLEARGSTPPSLAASLIGSLLRTPLLGAAVARRPGLLRSARRALLPARRPRRRRSG